jgi:hypothetical protein
MAVISGALGWIMVGLVILIGIRMVFGSIRFQFDSGRAAMLAKGAWRFRKGLFVFAAAITVIALVNEYVVPGLGGAIVAFADGMTAGAQSVGDGASQAVPILVGIILALAYWTFVSVKWIAKAKSKDSRLLRQIGAGAVFMPLMIAYLALCFS